MLVVPPCTTASHRASRLIFDDLLKVVSDFSIFAVDIVVDAAWEDAAIAAWEDAAIAPFVISERGKTATTLLRMTDGVGGRGRDCSAAVEDMHTNNGQSA